MQVASAYGHEPVATTSLLAYVLCHDLHPSLEEKVNWLGVLGTFGDLGSGVKWQTPFPDMGSAIKQYEGKQKFSQAVSLINARESGYQCMPVVCMQSSKVACLAADCPVSKSARLQRFFPILECTSSAAFLTTFPVKNLDRAATSVYAHLFGGLLTLLTPGLDVWTTPWVHCSKIWQCIFGNCETQPLVFAVQQGVQPHVTWLECGRLYCKPPAQRT